MQSHFCMDIGDKPRDPLAGVFVQTVLLNRGLGVTKMSADSRLRIVGFGACMISGYPHESGGMLETACKLIEKELALPVTSQVISLGGFPAPRARKHLSHKVLESKPDYVVLQFGTTDSQCPIRTQKPLKAQADRVESPSAQPNSSDTHHRKPTTALSPLRWELISLLGLLKRAQPITPLSSYIAAMGQMMLECRSAGVVPVVLSPFVYGSRYTMRHAVCYANALRDLQVTMAHGLLIDCIDSLAHISKSRILMHDGVHLSNYGQQLIGRAIANSIVAHVRAHPKKKAAAVAA